MIGIVSIVSLLDVKENWSALRVSLSIFTTFILDKELYERCDIDKLVRVSCMFS